MRVIHAFLPLLRAVRRPGRGQRQQRPASLTRVSTPRPDVLYPGVAYPASKTAVNMITVQYAKAFPNMRINAVEPGFTKTDLNGNTGTQTVEQGAEIIVRMAQVGPDGPTGATSTPTAPCPGDPKHQALMLTFNSHGSSRQTAPGWLSFVPATRLVRSGSA